ncbi:MAG TPA: AAA family ATPase [Chitinophagaceae bacterium]|nr:AAA family ATPase [Chitinophagaceae bacterium]
MWTITNDKNWAALEAQFEWVAAMRAVPQDARHHAEGNVAVHTQMVLQALQEQPDYQRLPPPDQEVLWAAALLHDVEKRSTTVAEPDGSITAHGHARKGAQTARRVLYMDIPTPFALREQITALVRYHGLPLWLLEKPNPVKELVKASLELDTRQLALLARADALGRICADQADLLYRIDCFEAYCREQGCWGQPRPFATAHARMHYLQQEQGFTDYIPFDQPLCEVILLSGLPGAGKDSYIKKHLPGLPVISLDDIRVKMNIDPTDKTGNGHVIQAAREQARVFLRSKTPFIWNATNSTRSMRTQLVELFTAYKAAVKIVYVEAPYGQLYSQNRNREAVVPAAVLEKLAWKLEPPAPWEAHEVVYCI